MERCKVALKNRTAVASSTGWNEWNRIGRNRWYKPNKERKSQKAKILKWPSPPSSSTIFCTYRTLHSPQWRNSIMILKFGLFANGKRFCFPSCFGWQWCLLLLRWKILETIFCVNEQCNRPVHLLSSYGGKVACFPFFPLRLLGEQLGSSCFRLERMRWILSHRFE